MVNFLKILLWGFLLWLGIFAISFLIFPFKKSGSPLFETLMAISVTGGSVLFSLILFRNLEENYFAEGLKVGFIWLCESILIDLPLFSTGSMEMTLGNYFQDIGFTYLIIPIVTTGIGWILDQKIRHPDEHVHLKNAENEEAV